MLHADSRLGCIVGFPFHGYMHELAPLSDAFPEFQSEFAKTVLRPVGCATGVYGAVREVLFRLGYDNVHYGTTEWNPLSGFLRPGGRAIVKPNLVRNPGNNDADRSSEALTTNAEVLRPLIDYCLLATEGHCSVVVADTPLKTADWEAVIASSGIGRLLEWYDHVAPGRVAATDWRKDIHEVLSSTPASSLEWVELRDESAFSQPSYANRSFRVNQFDHEWIGMCHSDVEHRYPFERTVRYADLIINVPKLKSHKKAGLSGALKNQIGFVPNSSVLPHYRVGDVAHSGDECESYDWRIVLRQRLRSAMTFGEHEVVSLRNLWQLFSIINASPGNTACVEEGAWPGNDTLWRTIIDIETCLRKMCKGHRMVVVDGVVAGGGEGGSSKSIQAIDSGIIVGGLDAARVDCLLALLCGKDWRTIPSCCGGISSQHAREEVDATIRQLGDWNGRVRLPMATTWSAD